MTLVRYRYNNPMTDFFNTYFNEGMENNNEERTLTPKANIVEAKDKYTVQLAMPGADKENISMNVEGNELIIKATRKEEQKAYYMKEFEVANYERRFELPETINDEKIEASFKNGVLNIELPLKEEVHKKKEIAVA
ncbi:MAG TPA: Hsp20/alpha crystallin family protein [Bacteroidales bacterium]|nr:Hsp20/alpha crystallin family protein [Bacteroidales bacterium]